MQKINFEEPKLNVVAFEAEDVITTSLITGEGSGTSGGFLGPGFPIIPNV